MLFENILWHAYFYDISYIYIVFLFFLNNLWRAQLLIL